MRYRSAFHLPCHGKAQLIIATMLTLLAITLVLASAEPQAASGTVISADEIAATLKQSIANNTVDQPIKLAEIPGGHKASLALLRRTKAETSALIHDYVTEIYQIVDGSGTLVTGGSLEDPKENDLTRLNAGMSHTGVHRGGESRKVKVKDVIIVPAGMAHRFSELDGPITYLVYRFEPKR
jgi:mannose-6-phosphate isomerase-like protein (cupin superfamily)